MCDINKRLNSMADSVKFSTISGDYYAGMKKSDLANKPAEKEIIFEQYDTGVGKDKAQDNVLGEHEIIEARLGELSMMQDNIVELYEQLNICESAVESFKKRNTPDAKQKLTQAEAKVEMLKSRIEKVNTKYRTEAMRTLQMAEETNYESNALTDLSIILECMENEDAKV